MFTCLVFVTVALVSSAQACDVGFGGLPLGIGAQTIADNCQCTKTIVRPQVNQQVIDVPSVRRFVQNSVVPRVESYNYNKINTPCGSIVNAGLPNVGPFGISNVGPLGLSNVGNFGFSNVGPLGLSNVGPLGLSNVGPYGLSTGGSLGPNIVGSLGCSANIPLSLGARTIADNCQCTKTVVRPTLRQQLIDIPANRRIIQNTVSPVVEAFNYNTRNINGPLTGPITNGPCGLSVGGPVGIKTLRYGTCGNLYNDVVVGGPRFANDFAY